MTLQPFEVNVPDEEIAILHARLAATRWPDEPESTGWMYGGNGFFMRQLARYWQEEFDWRAQERYINSFAQFRAEVDGVGIHYVYGCGKAPSPLPLRTSTFPASTPRACSLTSNATK